MASSEPAHSALVNGPKRTLRRALEPIFLQRSIAIIGACDRTGTVCCALLENVKQAGYGNQRIMFFLQQSAYEKANPYALCLS